MESEIKKHFDDYEGAIEAFKAFVNAIVWKSNDIEEGASEEEIAAHVEEFIHEQGEYLLSSFHQQIMEYMWTFYCRYQVFYYELDDANNVIEGSQLRFHSEKMDLALGRAAYLYRNGKKPLVKIYDRQKEEYISEWSV